MADAPLPSLTNPIVLGEIRDRVSSEHEGSEVATRDLARYYRLLREQLADLHFSQPEIMLAWHGLVAAREQHFDSLFNAVVSEEWRLRGNADLLSVNPDLFLPRLQALHPLQTMALIDALERFNARNERDGRQEYGDVLRAVGFQLK